MSPRPPSTDRPTDRPLVVPFGRSAFTLSGLRSSFDARSRRYLSAAVTSPGPLGGILPRDGLEKRRDSVNYPSVHPQQMRQECNEVFCAGQDDSTAVGGTPKRRCTTHAARR